MEKINWGIIGCGDVTELKSGPAFNKVPQSALVAVMRRDGAKARDYADRHGVPKWYQQATELIHDDEINAVYIATPPSSHFEYAMAALNAGKHVYLEKPMTLNYGEAQAIADKVREKNARLVVAHYRREQPMFKKIKQLLQEGIIGKVRCVNLLYATTALTPEQLQIPKTAWRINPAIAGGGLFHDLAPHQMDLMYYFFGAVKHASGTSTNQAALYNAADAVAGNLLFENGVLFTGSWCFTAAPIATDDRCLIIGSEGSLEFSVFNNYSFTVHDNTGTRHFSFEKLEHVQQPMIEATVNYFLGAGPNPCTATEGAAVMKLLDQFTQI